MHSVSFSHVFTAENISLPRLGSSAVWIKIDAPAMKRGKIPLHARTFRRALFNGNWCIEAGSLNKTLTATSTRGYRVYTCYLNARAPAVLSQHATQESKEIDMPRVFNAVRTLLWALKTPEK